MSRRTLVAVVAGASLLVFGASGGVAHAQSRGAGCMLQGVFKTIPTLKSDTEKIRYTITGKATDCHWSDGAPEPGRRTAAGDSAAGTDSGTTRGPAPLAR